MMGLDLLLVLGAVAAVIWAGRRGWTPLRPADRTDEGKAIDILERRYAQGEIDGEEFRERRAVLER